MGVNMSEWTSVKDKFPEKDAPVWYFFEHTGVSQGEFYGFHGCYEGAVDADGEIAIPQCKLPDCEFRKGCSGIPYFGGDRGVLGGDVTHWMPDTGQDKPEGPTT
jgi:hypothetical protein